jgi:peroxiredoxin
MAGVGVGSKAPDFELPDQQGYPWCLSGELETGPVVLIFYRGDWCSYCNGQLVSYARNFEEFEGRGAQVAGISVDPPDNNARMVGKLLLPFPLLSDPRGDLIKRYGFWDEEEGVARPSIVVVDRSREIRYFYSGSDFADRPGDAEVFAALEGLDGSIERVMGNPEIRVFAEEARRDSVRPDKAPRTLDKLIPYYRGVYFTTVALKKRFARWGRSGREAFREVGRYQTMVRGYQKALEQTVELKHAE